MSGVSPVPKEAREYQGRRAGLVSRVLAAAVDVLVVVVWLVGLYAAWVALLFALNPRRLSFPAVPPFVSLFVGSVAVMIYLTVGWASTGRSYGKHVMGLRVVGRRSGRVGPAVALLRAVLCVVFPAGLLWVAVSPQNRSLQDVLLRTTVIYDWSPRPRRVRG